eukprot:scaffold593_cov382-Prasinococcus_capsulatus_cf.AAC.23
MGSGRPAHHARGGAGHCPERPRRRRPVPADPGARSGPRGGQCSVLALEPRYRQRAYAVGKTCEDSCGLPPLSRGLPGQASVH